MGAPTVYEWGAADELLATIDAVGNERRQRGVWGELTAREKSGLHHESISTKANAAQRGSKLTWGDGSALTIRWPLTHLLLEQVKAGAELIDHRVDLHVQLGHLEAGANVRLVFDLGPNALLLA